MKQPTLSCEAIQVPHNYSSQTLNSTVMANEKLRDILARVSLVLFLRCDVRLYNLTVYWKGVLMDVLRRDSKSAMLAFHLVPGNRLYEIKSFI